ncbi:interleukin 17-like protein [Glandiceps talaboti]
MAVILSMATMDQSEDNLSTGSEHHHVEQLPIEPCPLEYGSGAALNERSNCPWYYEVNTDMSRYPRSLNEAHCHNCLFCITDNSQHSSWQCQPVTYDIWVLSRSVCIDGVYQYQPVLESIGVSCTCVRPRY